jgi:hypothetical protein
MAPFITNDRYVHLDWAEVQETYRGCCHAHGIDFKGSSSVNPESGHNEESATISVKPAPNNHLSAGACRFASDMIGETNRGENLPFPALRKPPIIDWDEIKSMRKARFPKIPMKAVQILKETIQGAGSVSALLGENCHLMLHDNSARYPPDPIHIFARKSDLVWLLDLLDRYGGELVFGKLKCTIRRKRKRYPFFVVQEISEETTTAFHSSVGSFYERFMEIGEWRLLAEELPETDLMAVIIESREDSGAKFLGLFDRVTAALLTDRTAEGMPVEEFLSWN